MSVPSSTTMADLSLLLSLALSLPLVALGAQPATRCRFRRGGRAATRVADFTGVGSHCGKRLRERLREATGNCGSGGDTPCSGGANRARGRQASGAIHGLHLRGCSYVLPPGKRNASTRIPTVLQPHITCTRAALAI
jgi:hypothetical protein